MQEPAPVVTEKKTGKPQLGRVEVEPRGNPTIYEPVNRNGEIVWERVETSDD